MKLLPPKELNTRLNDQKKSEYDAGMFLAKKIDKLREDVADAQKEHDETIEKLTEEFQSFTSEHSKKKEIALGEIEDLEEKRRILRIPLDAEWSKVGELLKENTETASILSVQAEEAEILKVDLENRYRSLARREEDVRDLESIGESNLKFAQKKNIEAEKILKEAKDHESESIESIKARVLEVSKRETDVAYRELDVENNLKIIAAEGSRIEREGKHLESRQRSLKAAFAELERKQNGTIRNTDN